MIGVSLLFCDKPDWVRTMVESLELSDLKDWKHVKVAIDNGSRDATITPWLRERGWIVMRNPTNIGIIAGRNQTFWRLWAEGVDSILEVHSDMRFPGRWLRPLVAALWDCDTWLACPAIVTRFDRELDLARASLHDIEDLCARKRAGEFPDTVWTRFLTHPCLHKAQPFRERGFYDDRFLWHEYEDLDWYHEIRQRGKKVAVIPESVVYHLNAGQRRDLAPKGIPNERSFREKWQLSRDWLAEVFPLKDAVVCFLSDKPLDRLGVAGQQALELAMAGQQVLFVEGEASEAHFAGLTLDVVSLDGLAIEPGAIIERLAERGYRIPGELRVGAASDPMITLAHELAARGWRLRGDDHEPR